MNKRNRNNTAQISTYLIVYQIYIDLLFFKRALLVKRGTIDLVTTEESPGRSG